MANSEETNIDVQINNLRSLLRSDDDLQVHTSGSYENVRMRLDHDIQLSFLFDFLTISTEILNLGNVHDLRLTKYSSKCSLNSEQWQNVQLHFEKLQRQNDPKKYFVRDFVQEMQDYLLEVSMKGIHSKKKSKKNSLILKDEEQVASKFRGADLIFNRILHDLTIDRSKVLIGYEDRFTGVHEIPFNEFKKVHEHEYGVPMHRIRHYKIYGKIVWDRTKKIDILTGSDISTNLIAEENQIRMMTQGVYGFDHSASQWVLCPQVLSLSWDDPKNISANDVCLPSQCQFLTWNILFDYHHSSKIHTDRRYAKIFETLKSLAPDVISLQEVTNKFLILLLNQYWLVENNYYITIMGTILQENNEQPYGQLLLTKNFRPRSFDVVPLDLSEENLETKTMKKLLIARFGLSTKVTIDLVNLHLHSSQSKHAEEKRYQTLRNLFEKFQTKNYMLIGDFNFGDSNERETKLLKSYEKQLHDLWSEHFDLEQEPGFTFDPSKNICAKITSETQISRRFDRYLIHNLNNLFYSIEHLAMIGQETIPIDPMNNDADKRINQSDHFGLQLILNFRTRSISHRSAFTLVPTIDQWSSIKLSRQEYDTMYKRWPPHINILWPFFDLTDSEDDHQTVLLPLRKILTQQMPFEMMIDSIDTFNENNVIYMKSDSQSSQILEQLFERVKQTFPQCCVHQRSQYTPHMTLDQGPIGESSELKFEQNLKFPVKYLYILQRPHDDDDSPFRISYQLPLGSVIECFSPNVLPQSDPKIRQFFELNQLYSSEENYEKKIKKFEKLNVCFKSMFNVKNLRCFKHEFVSYGSFRFGIDGDDLDTIFILREENSDEIGTDFDETLRQLKREASALSNRIVSILENLIKENFSDEIEIFRRVEALFPIISIVFTDKTRVEISIEIQTKENSKHSIQSISDNELVLSFSQSPPLLQHVLSFVRRWAKNQRIYGQIYGFLPGLSWSILCSSICKKVLSSISNLKPAEQFSSIEKFRFELFFDLIREFFVNFSKFDWNSSSVDLYSENGNKPKLFKSKSIVDRGVMKIFCPSSKQNSARTTIRSTKNFIEKAFRNSAEFLENVNATTIDEKFSALEQIVNKKNSFPSSDVRSIFELKITAENQVDLVEWSSWIKSRFVHFFDDLDSECRFNLEPSTELEQRSNSNELFYSLAFHEEPQTIFTRKNFEYFLRKFTEQCSSFKSRNDSMNFTHRLVSVDDWKIDRMQPKAQRVKK